MNEAWSLADAGILEWVDTTAGRCYMLPEGVTVEEALKAVRVLRGIVKREVEA